MYKSIDGGQILTSQSTGLAADGKEFMVVEISPADRNRLYVSVDRTTDLNPFTSADGGASWQQPADMDAGGLSIFGNQACFFANPVAAHPTDAGTALTVTAGQATVLKTVDGGTRWSYSGNGYTAGRTGTGISSVHFAPGDADRMILFLNDHGPVLTTDGGSTWRLLLQGSDALVGAVDPNNPDLILAAARTGQAWIVKRTIDGGDNWIPIAGTEGSYRFLQFHPQDADWVYAGTKTRSLISRDKGLTWDEVPGKEIRAVFPGNGDIIYAVEGASLWRSDDRGAGWDRIADLPVNALNDLAVDPEDPDRVYLAGNNGVFVLEGTV